VLLRTIGNQKLKSVVFRDQRPHMMAEDINFELTDDQVSHWSLEARIGSVVVVAFISDAVGSLMVILKVGSLLVDSISMI